MLFGVGMFSTDYAIRPDELAREAEDRGFESLWVPEHTHIPASRRSPWPGGGELPKEYWHTYDPFVALTAAAAVTSTIKIATGICLIIERDPITTAKEVASLDFLSGGRFIFGIGGGWNAEEMENHGTDFKKRWRLMRERILAMKEIWTKEEAEYHGEFVNFDPIWAYPKPRQEPHPPILMGGYGPTTFDRVIEYCDGWMPIGFRLEGLKEKIAELKKKAENAGRNPESISVTVFGPKPDKKELAELSDLGIERVILMLPAAARDTVLPLLDQYAALKVL
ncbi:MAG TPA: LLM class F420-dependent oxidoreductase [Blastocatellia bacterium]|nr:LLM class F420-dependent oxidoreductase [Blastocatellia bacterium]